MNTPKTELNCAEYTMKPMKEPRTTHQPGKMRGRVAVATGSAWGVATILGLQRRPNGGGGVFQLPARARVLEVRRHDQPKAIVPKAGDHVQMGMVHGLERHSPVVEQQVDPITPQT